MRCQDAQQTASFLGGPRRSRLRWSAHCTASCSQLATGVVSCNQLTRTALSLVNTRGKFGAVRNRQPQTIIQHVTNSGCLPERILLMICTTTRTLGRIMPLWPEETMPPPCGAHRARAQSDECMQLLSKCPQVDSGATSFWCKSASTRMQHAGQGNRSTLILDCGSATLLVNIGKIEEHPGSRPCGVNEATSNAAGTAL